MVDVVDVNGVEAAVVDAPACSQGFGGEAIVTETGMSKGSMRPCVKCRVLTEFRVDNGERTVRGVRRRAAGEVPDLSGESSKYFCPVLSYRPVEEQKMNLCHEYSQCLITHT